MSQPRNNNAVRQHQRYQCNIAAAVRFDEADARRVKLSPEASTSATTVACQLIDASRGGVGFSSKVYLPPSIRLVVSLKVSGIVQEVRVKVQRVRMLDRTPSYYIGTSFIGTSEEHGRVVEALLAECAQMEGKASA